MCLPTFALKGNCTSFYALKIRSHHSSFLDLHINFQFQISALLLRCEPSGPSEVVRYRSGFQVPRAKKKKIKQQEVQLFCATHLKQTPRKLQGPLRLSALLNWGWQSSLSTQFQGCELHCDFYFVVLSLLNIFHLSLLSCFLTCFNVLFINVFLLVFNIFRMQFLMSNVILMPLQSTLSCLVFKFCYTNDKTCLAFCICEKSSRM